MSAPPGQFPLSDERYYQNTGRMGFARRISAAARGRVYSSFIQVLAPKSTDRILDIGTSDDTGADANMLEQLYPHKGNLTCVSLSNGDAILKAYPGVHHIQISPGQPLPFGRNAFDIVYSCAVLEHVGSASRQRAFLEEMCKVAPRRFLAVPNRWFPVEHHTCIPFIHYVPKPLFRRLLRGTRYDFWSHEDNLNYISATDLIRLWPGDRKPTITRSGIGFGPWKSNLLAYQT